MLTSRLTCLMPGAHYTRSCAGVSPLSLSPSLPLALAFSLSRSRARSLALALARALSLTHNQAADGVADAKRLLYRMLTYADVC